VSKVESLKTEKKQLRAALEEKESSIKSKDEEIKNLEREVKTLIQVRLLQLMNVLIWQGGKTSYVLPWTNLSKQDKTWAEFTTVS